MSTLVWQGWRIDVPPRWDPIKLEGSYDEGYAALADLLQQRLGIRWKKLGGKRFDPQQWALQMMRQEVGMLAAEEARPVPEPPEGQWSISLLYTEPDPPGRDIWIGYSERTQRGIVLAYQTRRRDRTLAETLVPALRDWDIDQPMPWSVFELSCVVPPGFGLLSQRLNAGDLSLLFGTPQRREIIVRQVAVAKLALTRMPLDKWLIQQHRMQRRHYRSIGQPQPTSLAVLGGRELSGFSQERRRRRRYFYKRWLPASLMSVVLHDEQRDRLVILEATDEGLIEELAATIGWAQGE
jgi:hypothetical protein